MLAGADDTVIKLGKDTFDTFVTALRGAVPTLKTNKDVCAAFGVSPSSFHRWRRGETSPLVPQFVAAMDGLGMEVIIREKGAEVPSAPRTFTVGEALQLITDTLASTTTEPTSAPTVAEKPETQADLPVILELPANEEDTNAEPNAHVDTPDAPEGPESPDQLADRSGTEPARSEGVEEVAEVTAKVITLSNGKTLTRQKARVTAGRRRPFPGSKKVN